MQMAAISEVLMFQFFRWLLRGGEWEWEAPSLSEKGCGILQRFGDRRQCNVLLKKQTKIAKVSLSVSFVQDSVNFGPFPLLLQIDVAPVSLPQCLLCFLLGKEVKVGKQGLSFPISTESEGKTRVVVARSIFSPYMHARGGDFVFCLSFPLAISV